LSDHYVLLTGSKNNAGDFLIKYRAMRLLRSWQPQRELVDVDGWKPIDDERLALINAGRGLILTGGPAVRATMRPTVYALRPRLDDIAVPITTLGVGWSAPDGRWHRTRRFAFNDASRELLGRIEADGLQVGVRDYHTQNVLHRAGLTRTVMTGCPALYALDRAGEPLVAGAAPRRVTISMGVRFAVSRALLRQAHELVEYTHGAFPEAETVVAFHHAIDDAYLRAYGRPTPLYRAQRTFTSWLASEGVRFVDLSGSAERLMEHYEGSDLHLGYRVHAHIFMTSIRRPSLLLAEDGRGSALREVLGGHVLDAFDRRRDDIAGKVLQRLGVGSGQYDVPEQLAADALELLTSDRDLGWPRAGLAVAAVEARWPVMERFVRSLP